MDFFFDLNGRLSTTNGLIWITAGGKCDFISGKKLSIKRLCE